MNVFLEKGINIENPFLDILRFSINPTIIVTQDYIKYLYEDGYRIVELDKVNKVLSVKNDVLYELPSSGGFGIYWYMVAGVAMMILATAIQYKNRRKEVLERIDKR